MLRRAIAAAAALTVACSLASLDGLSDGAPLTAPPPGDAGPGSGDAPSDAIAQTPPGADAQADAFISSCASAPAGAFCDDFEQGLANWTSNTTAGNTFLIEEASSVSPTHSAVSTALTGGLCCLTKALPGAPQTIEVDVDVRFEAVLASGADYDFLGLRGPVQNNLSVQVRSGVLEFDEDATPIDGAVNESFTSTGYAVDAAWHHVRWTNQRMGSTADVQIFVDGKKVGGMVASSLDYTAPLVLQVGDCSISSSPWKVRFDNVVVVTK